ncbi:WG repeat-containing protein, partial [Deltaproteobacteria bacterium OttesenSCG-928-K17]|nr:WG repeat-containing protein [Deltaproteobacteria bacterium OttesenSCG-928-K17]
GRSYFKGDNLTPAKIGSKWGIIDTKGQWLVEPEFDEIFDYNDNGLAKVKLNGKYGLIDTEGQLIVEPKFHHLHASMPRRGHAPPQLGGDLDVSAGNALDSPLTLNNGLIIAGNNGEWGLLNTQGQWVIEPKFDGLNFLSKPRRGSLPFGQSHKYRQVWRLYAPPQLGGDLNVSAGNKLDNPLTAGESLIAAKMDAKWGFIDARGQWTVEPRFDDVKQFQDNGLALAKANNLYGVINAQGKWVLAPAFTEIYFFSDKGLNFAKIGDNWGIIDATGQWVLEPGFTSMVLAPRTGNVAEVTGGDRGISVKEYLDYNSAAYRTGFDINVEEPGFRWEFADGIRTLYNRQGDKIMTIDKGKVVRNKAGEIIWPLGEAKP